MKILIFNWQDIKNPFGGGAEVHLHEIFSRMAGMGHDITLFCCRWEGSAEEEIIDGIKVIRKGSRNLFNFKVKPEYLKRFCREGYDLVIDDINKIPFYTPGFVRGPLLAISHHFFGKSIFREAGLVRGLYVYASEKLVDVSYKSTPFVVVSESTKQEFIERGFDERNFSIVQNAITQEKFPMVVGEKYPDKSIIYFGRLKKYKSPDHLLKAFAIVNGKIRGSKLYFMGRGDFQPVLEKMAKKLNISDNVVFLGYVAEEDKARHLSRCHVAVNTSMKEGWGITNIEANACGTPVVSANVPGLRDSVKVGQSGMLYEYGNIGQLAAMLLEILEDQSILDMLSNGAVEWAKSFSWDDSAKLMEQACLKTIEDFRIKQQLPKAVD